MKITSYFFLFVFSIENNKEYSFLKNEEAFFLLEKIVLEEIIIFVEKSLKKFL